MTEVTLSGTYRRLLGARHSLGVTADVKNRELGRPNSRSFASAVHLYTYFNV